MLASLQLGKLASRGRLNAVAPGPLVHIEDQLSKRRFLVDTGASFSIYPFSSKAVPTGPTLFGPAGKLIPCWGERSISLQFNNKKFTWSFLLAAVSFPIIGVDFLRHFKLLIDPAANRLVDTATCQAFTTVSSLATPAATAVAAAATPPSTPVISHSHRSSASVTGQQPQSPVSNLRHRSAPPTTAEPRASFGGGRRKTALRVVGCRLERWQRGPAATAAAAEHHRGGVAVCAASGGFSTGGEPVQSPSHSFNRGGASHLHNWAADFIQISAAGQREVSSR